MAVFFDMPLQWRWLSVGVKAGVVNWKQVDVAVGYPGMRQLLTPRDGGECTKWHCRDGLTKYST